MRAGLNCRGSVLTGERFGEFRGGGKIGRLDGEYFFFFFSFRTFRGVLITLRSPFNLCNKEMYLVVCILILNSVSDCVHRQLYLEPYDLKGQRTNLFLGSSIS